MKRSDYVLAYAHAQTRKPGETLFILKDRPVWMNDRINLLGGHLEAGEHPVDGAVRELQEESGLNLSGHYQPRYMGVITGSWKDDHVYFVHCVKVGVEDGDPKPREGETEHVFWADFLELKKDRRILPNLNFLVPLMSMDVSGWEIQDNNGSPDRRPYANLISLIDEK